MNDQDLTIEAILECNNQKYDVETGLTFAQRLTCKSGKFIATWLRGDAMSNIGYQLKNSRRDSSIHPFFSLFSTSVWLSNLIDLFSSTISQYFLQQSRFFKLIQDFRSKWSIESIFSKRRKKIILFFIICWSSFKNKILKLIQFKEKQVLWEILFC